MKNIANHRRIRIFDLKKSLFCPHCGRIFHIPFGLQQHVRKEHDIPDFAVEEELPVVKANSSSNNNNYAKQRQQQQQQQQYVPRPQRKTAAATTKKMEKSIVFENTDWEVDLEDDDIEVIEEDSNDNNNNNQMKNCQVKMLDFMKDDVVKEALRRQHGVQVILGLEDDDLQFDPIVEESDPKDFEFVSCESEEEPLVPQVRKDSSEMKANESFDLKKSTRFTNVDEDDIICID